MSLPVIAILTAADCGPCQAFRKSGKVPEDPSPLYIDPDGKLVHKIPGPNLGNYFSQSLFKRLLTGNPEGKGPSRFRVYEFYVPSRGAMPSMATLREHSEFKMVNGKLQRVTYTAGSEIKDSKFGSGKKHKLLIQIDSGDVKADSKGTSFEDFMSSNYPAQLFAFIPAFPGYIFADGKIWDEAATGKRNLFAIPNTTAVTEEKKPDGSTVWGINHSTKYYGDPIRMATAFHSNPSLLLEPMVDTKPKLPVPTDTVRMRTVGPNGLNYRIVGKDEI